MYYFKSSRRKKKIVFKKRISFKSASENIFFKCTSHSENKTARGLAKRFAGMVSKVNRYHKNVI